MRTKLLFISLIIIAFACNSNKQSQLAKLKDQRQAIDEQIKKLEEEVKGTNGSKLNPEKFKFVGLTEAKYTPFDHYVRVQGSLDGDQNAGVFAEAPGTISAKYADVGQQVTKGQVLAQIDDEQYRTQLQSLETNYKFAADMYEKQKRLWEQKIGSEVQYLQAKTTKESLEQQIASTKQQIDKFKIKSPISGTIEECNIKVGGVVTPDPRMAAYRVVAFSNLKVTAEVSEAYSARVQKGDKLIVQFPDINKEFEAKVDFVSKYISPVNRTFLIESKISNGIQDLKANMVAIIRINDYHTDNAITIPMNVIQNDQVGSYIYVVKAKDSRSAAYKQYITVGSSYNGVAEVLKGLNIGDKVVSVGYQELIDGEYIRF
jgi:RND family efflux transporter MFP subunit